MDIIQTAKELIKKGILLNDQELIGMANNLLNSLVEQPQVDTENLPTKEEKPKQKRAKKQVAETVATPKNTSVSLRNVNFEDFKNTEKLGYNSSSGDRRLKTPVSMKGKPNMFKDSGVEAKDADNITPSIVLSPRDRRKPEKVRQSCEYCKTVVMVNSVHAREFFICDECLENKTKGR